MNEVLIFIGNALLSIFAEGAEWLWESIPSTLNILPELTKGILPFLGLENVAKSVLLFWAIIIMLSLLGMYVSVKNRKKIWTFACGIVSIFSTISLMKSK